jgi:MFS family permease
MPLLAIAMADVPERDAGAASGIANVSMQLAVAVGIALLGALATHRTQVLVAHGRASTVALASGYRLAFLVGAGCVGAAVVVALLVLRQPSGTSDEPVPEPLPA